MHHIQLVQDTLMKKLEVVSGQILQSLVFIRLR